MGAEVNCSVRFADEFFEGKALLETNELIIRGKQSFRIPFGEMSSVRAEGGKLQFRFQGSALSLQLKSKAETWLQKILHPKSVLEKLGVTSESRVSVAGVDDQDFVGKLKELAAEVTTRELKAGSDLIFLGANKVQDLRKIKSVARSLKIDGALWIVFAKGKAAVLKDTEVMAAGKKAGLVDTKVVGFSSTHTALKFVIPLKKRSERARK